jgi:hypothetical protein
MTCKKLHIASLISIVAFLFFLYPVNAQELTKKYSDKGTIEIGGNVSYQHSNYIVQGSEAYTENMFSFFPYAGYFITDNFELGVNPLGVQTSWNSEDRTTLLSIFLCPSYNFRISETIYPFVEAQFGFTAQYITYSFSSLNSRNRGFSWGGRTGVKIILVEKCLLNAGLQYQQISLSPGGATSRSGINTLQFSAGFTFWF